MEAPVNFVNPTVIGKTIVIYQEFQQFLNQEEKTSAKISTVNIHLILIYRIFPEKDFYNTSSASQKLFSSCLTGQVVYLSYILQSNTPRLQSQLNASIV